MVPGPATQLLVSSQPPASVTAGSPFGYTIMAEDAQGNVATGFNGMLSVSIGANPGGSTLGGTLAITARNGVAHFTDMLNMAGAGYYADGHQRSLSSASPAAST